MPYIYNAIKQAQKLTVRFQKKESFPLPLAIIFFRFLTQQLETVFSSYQYDETVMMDIVRKIALRKFEEVAKLSKAVTEAQTVMKLEHGDVEAFKQAIGEHELEKEVIKKYAKSAGHFVYCHILRLFCELDSLVRKGMWDLPTLPNKKQKIDKEEKHHSEPKASMLPMWNKPTSSSRSGIEKRESILMDLRPRSNLVHIQCKKKRLYSA